MDDILKTLIIMAVFVSPLIRQIKESRAERSAQKPLIPTPDTKEVEVLRVPWKHQTLRPQPLPPKVEMKKDKAILPKMETSSTDNPEFTTRSAEKIRKAIIWSEILNRKY